VAIADQNISTIIKGTGSGINCTAYTTINNALIANCAFTAIHFSEPFTEYGHNNYDIGSPAMSLRKA